jgi:hypothetical protein
VLNVRQFLIKVADGNSMSKVVDIYNAHLNKWSTAELSVAREKLAATSLPNLCFFAGGKGTHCYVFKVAALREQYA